MSWDVVILGAGAAGMMAAVEAGRRGRKVLLVDHAQKAGEKIRISGGGRCNFTNMGIAVDRYVGNNPRFALSALKRFTQWDFLDRINGAKIAWHKKTLGQLFCDGSAKQIVDLFLRDLESAEVTLWLGCSVGRIEKTESGFQIETERGVQSAESVVVATGGKSIPKMGATSYGYKVAESFGLSLTETRPGLVPLTFAEQELEWIKALAGLAVYARVTAGKARFEEAILFTHRGLSGPAILQASSYWREGEEISLDLSQNRDLLGQLKQAKQETGRSQLSTALSRLLPERLARHLALEIGYQGPMAELSTAKLEDIAKTLTNWRLLPVGSEGYRTAEVTLGGVDTDQLNARTMEAKAVPGLYFIGEVVDITGWLGGYNFQWAWSSGWAAGQEA